MTNKEYRDELHWYLEHARTASNPQHRQAFARTALMMAGMLDNPNQWTWSDCHMFAVTN